MKLIDRNLMRAAIAYSPGGTMNILHAIIVNILSFKGTWLVLLFLTSSPSSPSPEGRVLVKRKAMTKPFGHTMRGHTLPG